MPSPGEAHALVCWFVAQILSDYIREYGRGHLLTNDCGLIVARNPDRADATLRKHFEIGNAYRRRAIVGEVDSIAASPAANLQTKKRANSRKAT